jgi:electron transfer flavoprotein beta subunit
MRILVCVKRVPAPGTRINVSADGLAVDTAFLGFTTSPHEECAVEAAVQLVEQHGGGTTVLTVGPPEAEEQLRYAVSVGATDGVLVTTDGSDWDPQRTAAAIVDAIASLEMDAPFDLILFGNESADSGGFQVGIRVARALGRPVVNGAKALSVVEETVRVERDGDAGRMVFSLPLPAAVGVKEGINLPRYPTMKGRLASKKAAMVTVSPSVGAGGQRLVSLQPPPEQASHTVVLGEGSAAAPAVVDLLAEIGVLSTSADASE